MIFVPGLPISSSIGFRRPAGRRRYTLVEMLMVTLIAAMLVAIVVPRISRTPRRMAVEQTLTTFRQAMMTAASRARASGQAQFVRLYPETDGGGRLAIVSGEPENLTHEWRPSRPTPDHSHGVLDGLSEYELAKTVSWIDIDSLLDDDGSCLFVFYPDGQAAGPDIGFVVGNETFALSVDPVTARPLIENAQ